MHAMLLRYYLAENGLDPDRDVELRVFPPPNSVANMASGNLDGMFFAEPWGQRAVFEGIGFIHLADPRHFRGSSVLRLSVTDKFITEAPNSYGAIVPFGGRATEFADKAENRKQVAELLAPAAYLNQPQTVLEQVLTGRYADGLGAHRRPAGTYRLQGLSLPIHRDLAADAVSPLEHRAGRYRLCRPSRKRCFSSTDATKRMREMNFPVPPSSMIKHTIMGKVFDPASPQAYVEASRSNGAEEAEMTRGYHDIGGKEAGAIPMVELPWLHWEKQVEAVRNLLGDGTRRMLSLDEMRRGFESFGEAQVQVAVILSSAPGGHGRHPDREGRFQPAKTSTGKCASVRARWEGLRWLASREIRDLPKATGCKRS